MHIENFGHGLHRLVYVSRIAEDAAGRPDVDVAAIVEHSSRNNAARALTGMLVAHRGYFIQALEGSHDTLTALMQVIAVDPRHLDLKMIGVEPIAKRAFGRWAMRGGRPDPSSGHFDPYAMSAAELMGILRLSAMPGAGGRRKAA